MNSQTVFLLITGVLLAGPTSALCQDPFTKITNSPVVTDLATCAGLSWGDYDTGFAGSETYSSYFSLAAVGGSNASRPPGKR